MLKKVLPLFLSCFLLLGTEAFAQPTGIPQSGDSGLVASLGTPADPAECLELDAQGNITSSGTACGAGGGATQLTDLTDVTAKSGNSTTVVMGTGAFTSGDCVEWDASGNAIASGGPCGGAPATTEAALEAQLTDVTDVYTNNDGALVGVIADLTDVTGISGNTTVVGTVAGAFTPGDCLEIDASGNIVGTGAACSAAPATTEAALESQLSDVSDVFTNNDGALDDDDVSDDRPTDMLSMAHDTYLTALNSGAASQDILKVDTGNILNFYTPATFYFNVGANSPLWLYTFGANDYVMYSPDKLWLYGQTQLDLFAAGGFVNLQSNGGGTTIGNSSTVFWTITDGNIVGDDNSPINVRPGTADTTDDQATCILGGGGGATRGASSCAYGNEHTNTGDHQIVLGDAVGSQFIVDDRAGATQLTVDENGVAVVTEVYGAGWNGDNTVPTKDAVYDKIETVSGGGSGTALLTGSEVTTDDTFDGKTVYAKVLTLSACPNAGTVNTAHGVVGGIETLLSQSSVVQVSPGGIAIKSELAFSSTGYDYWQIDIANGGNITQGSNANRSLNTCTATLYYTKP